MTCPKPPRQELGFELASAGLHSTSPLLLTVAEMLKQYILPVRAPGEAHESPTLPSSIVLTFLSEIFFPIRVLTIVPWACETATGLKQYIKNLKRCIGSKFLKEDCKTEMNV